jgi:hypothetical protein
MGRRGSAFAGVMTVCSAGTCRFAERPRGLGGGRGTPSFTGSVLSFSISLDDAANLFSLGFGAATCCVPDLARPRRCVSTVTSMSSLGTHSRDPRSHHWIKTISIPPAMTGSTSKTRFAGNDWVHPSVDTHTKSPRPRAPAEDRRGMLFVAFVKGTTKRRPLPPNLQDRNRSTRCHDHAGRRTGAGCSLLVLITSSFLLVLLVRYGKLVTLCRKWSFLDCGCMCDKQ